MSDDEKGIFDEILPISSSVFDDMTFDNDSPVFGEDDNILGVLKSHFQGLEASEGVDIADSEELILDSIDTNSLEVVNDTNSTGQQAEISNSQPMELEAGGD